MRFAYTTAFLAIALGSCAAPQREAPAPAPPPPPAPVKPAPQPAPPPAADWSDWPMTPGDWSYSVQNGGSLATYRAPDGAALLAVRCDLGRHVVRFARPGAASAARMSVRTTFGAVSWPATVDGTPPQTFSERAANDPALDQIAYSRGRFAIEIPGLAPLIAPAWAELIRVVEDCR